MQKPRRRKPAACKRERSRGLSHLWAAHLIRSNPSARDAIPSQSRSFRRKCLISSARESL